MNLETLIINLIFTSKIYQQQLITYISEEYFNNSENKKVVQEILNFYKKYKKIPSIDEMSLFFDGEENIQKQIETIKNYKNEIALDFLDDNINEWLVKSKIHNLICQFPEALQANGLKNLKEIVDKIKNFDIKDENEQEPCSKDILSMSDAFELYDEFSKRDGNVDYGFQTLNKHCDVFSQGEIFILAARGGTGKTNLSMLIGNNIANNSNNHTLFISLEMQAGQLAYRAAIQELSKENVDTTNHVFVSHKLESGFFRNQIIDKWKNFSLVQKPSLTVDRIEKYIELTREKYPKLNLVVIDYLGYITDTKSGSPYESVTRIIKSLKELAKRQNIRIMVLCQTSRSAEDGTVPIKLHHMRDSGAIEESADYILGLWNDETVKNCLHCEILKNRNGEKNIRFNLIKIGLVYEETEITENNNKINLKPPIKQTIPKSDYIDFE